LEKTEFVDLAPGLTRALYFEYLKMYFISFKKSKIDVHIGIDVYF
jgi:hypothetical protein